MWSKSLALFVDSGASRPNAVAAIHASWGLSTHIRKYSDVMWRAHTCVPRREKSPRLFVCFIQFIDKHPDETPYSTHHCARPIREHPGCANVFPTPRRDNP